MVEQALIQSKHQLGVTARLLHTSQRNIQYRIEKLGIDVDALQPLPQPIPQAGVNLEKFKSEIVQEMLIQVRGNVSEAARRLNISRDQLRYRLEKQEGTENSATG
ncbi:MAG: hypothetical protein HQ517_03205 [SAR324 cluster bacterium]|nr:hypothetical protein [SAR324 cluster bacterium]